MPDISDLRDAPFNLGDPSVTPYSWHGERKTIGDAQPRDFGEEDVKAVLYHGGYGFDDYDGFEAAVLELHDSTFVAYESWWGPTGSGFSEDAYGGDADVWFAGPNDLKALVLEALGDEGRSACGIPKEGLA